MPDNVPPDDVPTDDLDSHTQWAVDPSGRRYWIQGVPSFGGNPLAPMMRALKARLLGTQRPVQSEVQVGGVVMVTRVEGDVKTEMLLRHYNTVAEAGAKAILIAGQIEAGTFRDDPASGG